MSQWLASDGWGRQSKLVEGLEEEAEGAITVELQSKNIPDFDKYMESLTPENNRRNPWFGEYWEEVFGCTLRRNAAGYQSYERFSSQIGWKTGNQSTVCSAGLRLNAASGYEQESKVQFVVDAVYAFAQALSKLRHDLCGRREGVCSSMANYDRGAFYKNYLLNVSFEGESDDGARRPARNGNNRDGATRRLFAPFVYRPFFSRLSLSFPVRSSYTLSFEGRWITTGKGGREKEERAKEMLVEMTDGIIGGAIDLRELNPAFGFGRNESLSKIERRQVEISESYSTLHFPGRVSFFSVLVPGYYQVLIVQYYYYERELSLLGSNR